MYQRDLGVPFISFNTRTGHRSCAPEDCGRFVVTLPQGPVPVSGVFPAGVLLHLLETGIQAIQLSPYHTDPPARRSRRLDTTAGFLACYFPRSPFGSRVSHQIPRHLLSSLPATRAIQRCASWRSYSRQCASMPGSRHMRPQHDSLLLRGSDDEPGAGRYPGPTAFDRNSCAPDLFDQQWGRCQR
jgi:hypothetical protein